MQKRRPLFPLIPFFVTGHKTLHQVRISFFICFFLIFLWFTRLIQGILIILLQYELSKGKKEEKMKVLAVLQ